MHLQSQDDGKILKAGFKKVKCKADLKDAVESKEEVMVEL